MQLTQIHIDVFTGKICPYCGNKPEYVDSSVIYGTSYGMIYLCKPCDAYVGVHKGTDTPLGRLSNADLRHWKKQAHEYFDPVWQSGKIKRKDAYNMLCNHLGIPKDYCHIGMFSVETCKNVIEWAKAKITEVKKVKSYKSPKIRKKPATRYHSQREHNQYGIFNWFVSKGVKSDKVMIQCVKAYTEKCGFTNMDSTAIFSYIQSRFSDFAKFAINYLKQNT